MSTSLQLREEPTHLAILLGATELARYEFKPDTPTYEAPKPYLHPVRTLAGEIVTLLRPHDHVWHRGFQMTCTDVSGSNFWGGGTYVHGQEQYAELDRQGSVVHQSWERLSTEPHGVVVRERLDWLSHSGRRLMEERRTIEVANADEEAGTYRIRTRFHFLNVTGEPLQFSSPAIKGRAKAGYGGFFWRGPRSFTGGQVLTSRGARSDQEAMGARAEWLAFIGRHDGSGRHSSLVFVDHPLNPRYPTPWFVRSEPFACVSFAFMFDEVFELGPGAQAQFVYDVVVCDGSVDSDQAAVLAERALTRTRLTDVAVIR